MRAQSEGIPFRFACTMANKGDISEVTPFKLPVSPE